VHKIKVLIWNILRGGRNRVPQIKAALSKHNADVVFLSEFRNNNAGEPSTGINIQKQVWKSSSGLGWPLFPATVNIAAK